MTSVDAYVSFSTLLLLLSLIFTIIATIADVKSIMFPFAALHYLFYFYPMYDSIFGYGLVDMTAIASFGLEMSKRNTAEILLITSMAFAFLTGTHLLIMAKSVKNSMSYKEKSVNVIHLWILAVILISLVYYASTKFNIENALLLFTPARKELELAGWMRVFLGTLPYVLYGALCLSKTISGSAGKVFFFLLLSVPMLILGQRREIIAFVIFAVLIGNNIFISTDRLFVRRLGILSLLAMIAVPLTWYARVFFTQLGKDKIVDAFAAREVGELIFGSASHGLQSMYIQTKHFVNDEFGYLHSLQHLIVMPVPGQFWNEKPSSIPQIIKAAEGQDGNISMFFLNEVLFNFGMFTPVFFLVMVLIINYVTSRRNNNQQWLMLYSYCYGNLIMLFKNGWSAYILYLSIFFIFLQFIYLPKYRIDKHSRIPGSNSVLL